MSKTSFFNWLIIQDVPIDQTPLPCHNFFYIFHAHLFALSHTQPFPSPSATHRNSTVCTSNFFCVFLSPPQFSDGFLISCPPARESKQEFTHQTRGKLQEELWWPWGSLHPQVSSTGAGKTELSVQTQRLFEASRAMGEISLWLPFLPACLPSCLPPSLRPALLTLTNVCILNVADSLFAVYFSSNYPSCAILHGVDEVSCLVVVWRRCKDTVVSIHAVWFQTQ